MWYEIILESNVVDIINNTLSQFDSLENIITNKLDAFREETKYYEKKI